MRLAPALMGVVLAAYPGASTFLSAQTISIRTAHDFPGEQQAKAQLERLLNQYEMTRYTFTHDILIEERAIPRSHPVLTLNTRHLGEDDEALSAYLHEQIHWFLSGRERQREAAEAELDGLCAGPLVGGEDGARDLESDYLHRIVCELEREADLQLLGAERAAAVMPFRAGDHYRWIYGTVIVDHDKIQAVIKSHSLEIP